MSASPACLSAYERAHQQLVALKSTHQEVGVLQRQALQQAAEALMESLEHSADFVPAYVLLAAIFLCIQKPLLAEKYLNLAAEIDPNFSALQDLKRHMEDPVAATQPRSVQAIAATAIARVESFEKRAETVSAAPSGLQRLFKPLVPLIGSPQDLQQAIQVSFPPGLSLEDCFFLFAVMTQQSDHDAPTAAREIQKILGQLNPQYAKTPARFAQDLAGSPAGVLRHLHLFLVPFRARYASFETFQKALNVDEDPTAQRGLFEIMHAPDFENPLQALEQAASVLHTLSPALQRTGKLQLETLSQRLNA